LNWPGKTGPADESVAAGDLCAGEISGPKTDESSRLAHAGAVWHGLPAGEIAGHGWKPVEWGTWAGSPYHIEFEAIEGLYDRLSFRSYAIVDDYGNVAGCLKAVHDFLAGRGINVARTSSRKTCGSRFSWVGFRRRARSLIPPAAEIRLGEPCRG
jgi:Macrocin-O-methyltransferase (TylF)